MKKVFFILLLLTGPNLVWADHVSDLQKVLKAEEAVRVKLNSKLFDSLREAQTQKLNPKNKDGFEEELNQKLTKIVDNQNDIMENHLRIDFLNSFIDRLDGQNTTDIKKVSEAILADLAHKQLIANAESDSESQLWLFEVYLSIAIRDIMEPTENFGEFVKKYMIYSSLREPRSPSDFLKERDYITQ